METAVFDSDDLQATEEYLSRAFTPMTISGRPENARARVDHRTEGGLTVDELSFGYTMSYDAGPLDRLCLVSVNEGVHTSGDEVCGPGETFLVAHPGRPYRGEVREADYTIVSFAPSHLQRTAAEGPGAVRLTGTRPVDAEANRVLHTTVAYVRDTVLPAHASATADHPLVVGTALRHLAAVTLTCLPHTDRPDAGQQARTDSRDGHPDTLRRALAFIEDNAARDIGLAEIAAAVCVTPRALQYAFARHADTTPLRHLRRVRLDRAHADLLAAEPSRGSVTNIALRWGFAHQGRFAAHYREAYGRAPAETLRQLS
ncbi:AraC family transcriptional regulator [Streptomyces luteocolor]|uniref:AraC family transcriptional regulator n=1 Tax=Streptomyces luteocolor TaxID=285500 RepID=UPI00085370D5|nr:helix-turn-helix domain-containing protein [Streptomyces luteocolor]